MTKIVSERLEMERMGAHECQSKNVSRRVETYPVFGECMVCGTGTVVELTARQKAYYDTYVNDGWPAFYDHMREAVPDPVELAFLYCGVCSDHARLLLDGHPGPGKQQPVQNQD